MNGYFKQSFLLGFYTPPTLWATQFIYFRWGNEMPKMTVKCYDTVIHNEWYEDGASVLIGVVDGDHPEEAYWGWLDEKVYFYLDPEEMANLKVGDVLNDGEDFTIVEIDKDNPHFYEVDYELEEA